jgi:hypothetical protein
LWIAALLSLAVLLTLLSGRRQSWRHGLIRFLASALSAALLWFALFPPARPQSALALVVATADTDVSVLRERIAAGARVLALPEAPPLPDVAPVADLAMALRITPQAASLEILGRGLRKRDQDTVIGVPLHFAPLPELPGLRHWHAADTAVAGALWSVNGEVAAQADVTVALLDGADTKIASTTVDADGRFSLQTRVRAPGRQLYRLQVLGTDQRELERVDLPLIVRAGDPLKVLLLAGAPSPELKYLRRWAVDAGLQLSSRLALGANMQIGSAQQQTTSADWERWDLLLLDERSLAALGVAGRAELHSAVQQGLGVLLRLTGPLGSAERQWLAQLDLAVQAADSSTQIDWPNALTGSTDSAPEAPLKLSRRPLTVSGAVTLPLLYGSQQALLGVWRPLGRGRLGLLWLTDTYQLQLSGRSLEHAGLWQQVVATLTRANAPASAVQVVSPAPARLAERVVWCGLDPARRYALYSAAEVQWVHPDPATPGCAAAWPQHIGWAELRDEQTVALPLYVHGADSAPAQQARQWAEATLVRVHQSDSHSERSTTLQPGAAWPWWIAWMLVSGALWWYERRSWPAG